MLDGKRGSTATWGILFLVSDSLSEQISPAVRAYSVATPRHDGDITVGLGANIALHATSSRFRSGVAGWMFIVCFVILELSVGFVVELNFPFLETIPEVRWDSTRKFWLVIVMSRLWIDLKCGLLLCEMISMILVSMS